MFSVKHGNSYNLTLILDEYSTTIGIHPFAHERLAVPIYFFYKSLTGNNVFSNKNVDLSKNKNEEVNENILWDLKFLKEAYLTSDKSTKEFLESNDLFQGAYNRYGFPQGELGFKEENEKLVFAKLNSNNEIVSARKIPLTQSNIKELANNFYHFNMEVCPTITNYQIKIFQEISEKK